MLYTLSSTKQPWNLHLPQPLSSVVVVGVGYVGLPLAIRASSKGFTVTGFDIDEKKILSLQKREASYVSPEEQEVLSKSIIRFTNQTNELWHADIYIICVPTPVKKDHSPDLGPLESAARIVGEHIARDGLVIVESTVDPGVCENVVLPILEKTSGLRVEKDIYLAHCPERVNPGDNAWSTANIPRVIGATGIESMQRATRFYNALLDDGTTLKPMSSLKEAEAVKMIENAFRDINIAFVNELAMSFDRAGIDLTQVLEGAATKPFSFLPHSPGCGVGGHCIPVDPYYLIRYGEEHNFEHRFLKVARHINERMPRYTVERLARALKSQGYELKGASVALLGLSYKKGIGDTRESPALEIRRELEKKGARVRTFDPYVPHLSSVDTCEEALQGSVAAVIATDHDEFTALSPALFREYGVQVVVDGRNCLSKKAFKDSGVVYRGIGR